jgi:acyl-coenzyme A synthetase/AMP-(fatty) acid ligase
VKWGIFRQHFWGNLIQHLQGLRRRGKSSGVLLPGTTANPALAEELIACCRTRLSSIKCPRSVDFRATLPRSATGKLYKRRLKAEYWP